MLFNHWLKRRRAGGAQASPLAWPLTRQPVSDVLRFRVLTRTRSVMVDGRVERVGLLKYEGARAVSDSTMRFRAEPAQCLSIVGLPRYFVPVGQLYEAAPTLLQRLDPTMLHNLFILSGAPRWFKNDTPRFGIAELDVFVGGFVAAGHLVKRQAWFGPKLSLVPFCSMVATTTPEEADETRDSIAHLRDMLGDDLIAVENGYMWDDDLGFASRHYIHVRRPANLTVVKLMLGNAQVFPAKTD